MPNSKSLSKAARAAERRRSRNRSVRTRVKTQIAKTEELAATNSELVPQEAMRAIGTIDRAVSKGVFHKNKGARLKSRLMKKLNKEQSALSSQQKVES